MSATKNNYYKFKCYYDKRQLAVVTSSTLFYIQKKNKEHLRKPFIGKLVIL